MTDSFPRLHARTRRFSLGVPRGFTVAPDGSRVVFLRSRSGTDPVTCLWSIDARTGVERLLVDPAEVPGLPGEEDLPAAERARRERVREQAGGVVGYTCDDAVERAVFALSGRPFTVSLTGEPDVRPLDVGGIEAVVDPRIDPTGQRIAFVAERALHLHELAGGSTTALLTPEGDDVSYGLPDFAAAEEMSRTRGFWWSPDGAALLVARVDESPVSRWYIADPAHPDRVPAEVRYPAAGTPNAAVGLEIVTTGGARTPVTWDTAGYEYLATARWDAHGPLLSVQPRDQSEVLVLAVDPRTGATTALHSQTDPVWVENVPGVPARTASGALVRAVDDGGARRLVAGDTELTGPELQVREVLGIDGETVLFRASPEPTSVALYSVEPGAGPVALSPTAGLHSGTAAGGTLVRISQDLDTAPHAELLTTDGAVHPVTGHAVDPGLTPAVALHAFGERELRSAVLLPTGHVPGTPLPVLLDPYGGPHAQRVLQSRNAYLTSRWFADHGFAVLVTDGRGSPGRGPEFERAIHGDLAGPVLDDQVAALHAAAQEYPDLDLTRVGIRGWSFGGYLAALAVLRRPDVFHAGIAGAPVTDWTLYDTHYTERYLGLPGGEPYRRSSVIDDAAIPPTEQAPHRPLMIVHGLADDNVVAAHTLRLSSALLAAGRPHQVLPLSGVTHMTPQEVVAENLLLLQVRFLQEALGIAGRFPPLNVRG
ncbi:MULTISPECIES: S9 family peptidase [Pseudonocardia]|uniref:Prolyl tripeptidyl peptidase n=2 Tax=Pseudonocardia TaxID=1847 RepID=A0A1Y2MTB6_PSEAH|nr:MULTISPECIES: prolyl oligopeptidase family serine peptidase [Pseudonocardia]OSY38239.1 Prolyl tripeptidyl peptidase precursor [Pseudonocardia autotrophica]TDN71035.1 dipeptidyl-peptidase-4 [Pseudonocardia autotrophica]BBG01703.1 peptidase [Pseudonocardia autotrophica]GEC27422.1 peptidase [Pseudonocardia saturnea]